MKLVVMLIALICVGCAGMPDYWDARAEFLDDHPGAKILSVCQSVEEYTGEIRISYKLPHDEDIHVEVWNYHHVAEGMIRNSKEAVK